MEPVITPDEVCMMVFLFPMLYNVPIMLQLLVCFQTKVGLFNTLFKKQKLFFNSFENGMGELSSLFYAIPPFTRTYLVILLLTGFGGSWKLLDVFSLVFSVRNIVKQFQVWKNGGWQSCTDLASYHSFPLYWRTFHELCI